jgi:hypothetical protein
MSRSGESSTRRVVSVALGLALLLAGAAYAAEVDSNTRARALLLELESSSEASAAREPVQRSNEVLKRAENTRQQNQEVQARLLDDLALEWAETARDLVKVSQLEQEARSLDEKLVQAETKVRRARALLEETETRRGRAQTELLRLDPESELLPATSATPTAPAATARPAPSGVMR